MSERTPESTNLDRYGNEPLPWARAREAIVSVDPMTTWFLSTTGPDGRPHVAGVGARWHAGDFYFTSGPGTAKARYLAQRPACAIAARLADIDLVIEGDATRVDDLALFDAVMAGFQAGGWPAETDGTRVVGPYSAPSAGPPPWHLYRLVAHTMFGVAIAEPWGASRWRFG